MACRLGGRPGQAWLEAWGGLHKPMSLRPEVCTEVYVSDRYMHEVYLTRTMINSKQYARHVRQAARPGRSESRPALQIVSYNLAYMEM